jgi:hypothetical protein
VNYLPLFLSVILPSIILRAAPKMGMRLGLTASLLGKRKVRMPASYLASISSALISAGKVMLREKEP